MTWDGKEDTAQWQNIARAKLSELIGLDVIEQRKTDLKMEIDTTVMQRISAAARSGFCTKPKKV